MTRAEKRAAMDVALIDARIEHAHDSRDREKLERWMELARATKAFDQETYNLGMELPWAEKSEQI